MLFSHREETLATWWTSSTARSRFHWNFQDKSFHQSSFSGVSGCSTKKEYAFEAKACKLCLFPCKLSLMRLLTRIRITSDHSITLYIYTHPHCHRFSFQGDMLHLWWCVHRSGLAQGSSMGPLSNQNENDESNLPSLLLQDGPSGEEDLYILHKQRELWKIVETFDIKYCQ